MCQQLRNKDLVGHKLCPNMTFRKHILFALGHKYNPFSTPQMRSDQYEINIHTSCLHDISTLNKRVRRSLIDGIYMYLCKLVNDLHCRCCFQKSHNVLRV